MNAERFQNHLLKPYVVLYREHAALFTETPMAFICQAEDGDHAEEQCQDAVPDMEVLWVVETDNVDAAYKDYWDTDN